MGLHSRASALEGMLKGASGAKPTESARYVSPWAGGGTKAVGVTLVAEPAHAVQAAGTATSGLVGKAASSPGSKEGLSMHRALPSMPASGAASGEASGA